MLPASNELLTIHMVLTTVEKRRANTGYSTLDGTGIENVAIPVSTIL